MQDPQITFRGMDHSDAVERRIRTKVAELERFGPDLTSCRVTVNAQHKRHHKGNLYSVRLELELPDKTIVSGRERHKHRAHEDFYVALRDTFDAAVRQLEDHVRRRRGKVKRHTVPDHGTVERLFPQEGYGFVRSADGTEVYFHEHSVVQDKFPTLEVGDEVRLVVAEREGEKGPQASTVTPVGKHHVVGRTPK